jgi:uncharacterized protein YgiM (DUF1202 family)
MRKLIRTAILLGAMTTLGFTAYADVPTQTSQTLKYNMMSQSIAPRTVGVAKVTGSNVNMRAEAGLSGQVIAVLAKGTIVELSSSPSITKDGYTWKVVGYNGKWGYVATTYLETIPE